MGGGGGGGCPGRLPEQVADPKHYRRLRIGPRDGACPEDLTDNGDARIRFDSRSLRRPSIVHRGNQPGCNN